MINAVIIDDEEWVRYLIKGLIPWKQLGIDVAGEAKNGLEGLDICMRLKPEIILTDIRMPGMGGMELLEKLAEILPESKVVIISGYDDFSYAQKAINFGVCGYILKPVNDKEAVNAIIKARDLVLRKKTEKENNSRLKTELVKLQAELPGGETEEQYYGDNSGHSILQRAINYINERYNTDITLDETANAFFINPDYFSYLLKKETGKGFNEYITALRLEKAKVLLNKPHLKVVEIADMVGYRDDNYFTKVFKKNTGYTPSEYRTMMNKPGNLR